MVDGVIEAAHAAVRTHGVTLARDENALARTAPSCGGIARHVPVEVRSWNLLTEGA